MGLIKAAFGSAGGVLADQWKDYFYCDSMPADVLMTKGQKRNSGRSSNTKGSDNIISNGSVININEGQCMIIVESGKIVDLCAEPGEFTYDTSTEPSLFQGDLKGNISEVFAQMGKRFTFGGEAPKDQRIYFFNTKEIMGNKYGTPSPVPFRVVDQRAGIDIDIGLRCFGEYTFKVINPMILYKNVAGNVEGDFTRQMMESQMRSELLTALQPAFARISAMGIRYSAVPGHTKELADILREELVPTWGDRMGIEIQKIGMSSIKANEEDEAMIKELQKTAVYRNTNMAAAGLVSAQADAMKYQAERAAEAELIKRQREADAAAYEALKDAEAKKAEAEAIRYSMEQEAEGIRAKGLAEAEAIEKKAEAQKKMGEASVLEMYLSALPEVVKNAAAPLAQTDKIVMYGEGNSTKLVRDVMTSADQIMAGVKESTGIDVTSLISGFVGGKAAAKTEE